MLKLFLTSWPYGQLKLVDTLGPHPTIKDGEYIRYLTTGKTDTTTPDFLFDIPDCLILKAQVEEDTIQLRIAELNTIKRNKP